MNKNISFGGFVVFLIDFNSRLSYDKSIVIGINIGKTDLYLLCVMKQYQIL